MALALTALIPTLQTFLWTLATLVEEMVSLPFSLPQVNTLVVVTIGLLLAATIYWLSNLAHVASYPCSQRGNLAKM